MVEAECDALTEVFTGFGERGVSAETVAERVAAQASAWLGRGAPVGEFLADQLLLPLALAGGGCFRTGPLSSHATTHAEVLKRFLPVQIAAAPLPSPSGPGEANEVVEVKVTAA
jgi:RNA 3'-terminal phosphate cyclase (ATP)